MAIVLPDGLLQNPSSGYVRAWLRSQAEVLAVVSIPQEAFVPYGTGIKTSLVLLRKRPAPPSRYSFMARIRKVGYDVKGQPIYQRDEKGQIIRDASGEPLIDDDIEMLAQAYSRFTNGGFADQGDELFSVPQTLLNARPDARLDVEHYLPSDRALIEQLKAMGARRLGEIADIVTQKDDFRNAGEEEIRYIAISDIDALPCRWSRSK